MFREDRLIFCRFYPFSLPNDILHGLRVRRLSTGMNNALFNLCLWWVPAMPWRVFMNTSLSTEQAFIKVQSIEADLVKDKFLLNRTIHSLNIWYGFYIYVISKCHFVNKDSKKLCNICHLKVLDNWDNFNFEECVMVIFFSHNQHKMSFFSDEGIKEVNIDLCRLHSVHTFLFL